MNDDQVEAARAELQAIRAKIREDLARDLGGDPEDYCAGRHFQESTSDSDDSAVPDGGE